MREVLFIIITVFFLNQSFGQLDTSQSRFDSKKDILLMHFDCKTDVDDIHSMAALAMLMANPQFSEVNYHVATGTYGTQEGLYVPPNNLLELAFDDNWTDVHADFKSALDKVKSIIAPVLKTGGDIWIAEAGQSDFSASLLKSTKSDIPNLNCKERFHIVQHSDWNEEMTSVENLAYVKKEANYHRIKDGNAIGNGTPGFFAMEYNAWKNQIENNRIKEIWQLALEIATTYNNKEGRYNNKAVASQGVDFSDLSEVCWIFGLESIKDAEDFFSRFAL